MYIDQTTVLNKLQQFWRYMIDACSLQVRIYHAYCFLSFAAILFIIPFKFFLGLLVPSFLACVLAVFVGIGYYVSRVKRRPDISIPITAIAVNVLFALNYFYNGGIVSSEILLMSFSFVAIITITAEKEHWAWTIISLVMFLTPVLLEYVHPETVKVHYQSREVYFLDIILTYIVLLGLMRVIIPYIIRSYNFARNSAEQKAAALDKLNKEKNKLISIIAHDMRTPLSNIQTYLELLLDEDFSREETLLIKNSLLQSTRSTLDILGNLLSWSKNQMDNNNMDLQQVDLTSIIMAEQPLYCNIAANKNILLDYMIAPSIQVKGNNEMVKLIIRNLINNAIKFTSPGGSILVIADTNGDHCLIEVRDSGTGMPVYLDESVFNFQVNTTYGTANEKGVGMGLVLCKEYTEAQQGKLWFTNDKVSGTSFYLQLPLYK